MEVWGPLNQVKSPSGSYCEGIYLDLGHGQPWSSASEQGPALILVGRPQYFVEHILTPRIRYSSYSYSSSQKKTQANTLSTG